MKIVIVGAGITGLATYLFLHQRLNEQHHQDANDSAGSDSSETGTNGSNENEAKPKREHQIILVEAYDTSKIRLEYLLAKRRENGMRDEQRNAKLTTTTATTKITATTTSLPARDQDTSCRVDVNQDHTPGHQEISNTITTTNNDADNPTLFTPVTVGAALGIARNGLSVLSRIDGGDGMGDTLRSIMARGHAIEKLVFDCARGWKLGEADMTDERTSPAAASMGKERKEEERDIPPMLLIVRRALWEELYARVVRVSGMREEDVVVNKRVVALDTSDEDGKQDCPVVVRFGDGSVETADLVLGADGIRSAVRKAMFEKKKDGAGFADPVKDDVDYVTPVYE